MRSLIFIAALIPLTLADNEIRVCPKPVAKKEPKIDPQEHKCLATMIYGEARGESEQGMVAVAWTSKNRAVKKRICQVVLAPKQYSIFNDNPALKAAATSLHIEPMQKNVIDRASWKKSLEVSRMVLLGKISDPTYGSTHYVAYKDLKFIPTWVYKFEKVITIGNHTFFKDRTNLEKVQKINVS